MDTKIILIVLLSLLIGFLVVFFIMHKSRRDNYITADETEDEDPYYDEEGDITAGFIPL